MFRRERDRQSGGPAVTGHPVVGCPPRGRSHGRGIEVTGAGSHRRAHVSRLPGRRRAGSAAEWLRRNAHVPVLLALSGYVLWTRTRGWQRFVRDGRVLYSSNDAWYHYRQVSYTVRHFPETMPFDPWTAFPTGVGVGQFGTIYDQTVALAALVAGAGSPDATTVGLVLLFAPAVLGTLTLVPAYLLGRHVAGRTAGVVAVAVLALTPGGFLQRTTVGFADHHAAEVLLQTTALLAVVLAVDAAERHDPTVARLRAGEFETFRRPLVTALLAGVAVGAYVLVWPPGVVFGLVLGGYYAVHLSASVVRGRDPEHVALVGGIAALAAVAVTLTGLSSAGLEPVAVSLFQPAAFALLAVGLAGTVGLARVLDARALSRWYFPVGLTGTAVTAAAVVRLVAPAQFALVRSSLVRVFGYTLYEGGGSVSETRRVAVDAIGAFLGQSYGLAVWMALAGIVVTAVGYYRDPRSRSWAPALVLWFVYALLSTLTQVRFDYYLAVPVAVLTGVAVAWVVRRSGLGAVRAPSDLGLVRAAGVVLLVMALVGPFVSAGPGGGLGLESAVVTAQTGPDEVADRQASFAWLRANTPQEGQYAAPERAPFPPYPTVSPTDDYDYPPGTYGVVAWWDSGHQLTELGRRIPVANPFQDGRETAAAFFLERSEAAATDRVTWDDERARYVVVEWSLAVPTVARYASPVQFANVTGGLAGLLRPVYLSSGPNREFAGYVKRQAHYESLRVRLFRYHGSARAPRPVVTDWADESIPTRSGRRVDRAVVGAGEAFVRRFESLAAAREYVRADGSAQVGGVDGIPSERVPALEHYRLVHASASRYDTETLSGRERGARMKTFERVPGATVRGRAPPNATVTASVRLSPPDGAAFTYRQRARAGPDGAFEMTLPYSTSGYDEWGVDEGYTNVSVRALAPYTFTARQPGRDGPVATRSVHVPEGRVVGADERPINVSVAPE